MTKVSKVTKSTGLTVITDLPAVPDTLSVLKEELRGLKTITETQYKTEGNVEGVSGFNIQTETKIESLIKAFSSVMGRQNAYNAAVAELGLNEVPVFKVGGNSVDAVKHDILLRMAVIKHADRKAELDALVKEGEKFLTEADQYQMYLAKVAKATGGK